MFISYLFLLIIKNYIIGNIDVGLGKFCRNDTLFL